jgi:hypothetical protein
MLFTTQDGETIKLEQIVSVGPIIGNNGNSYYGVHLAGGQHVSILESFKARATFITDWQAV